jgi:formylmethanofuran--tetrahydromethanopterin N-formyltransferase
MGNADTSAFRANQGASQAAAQSALTQPAQRQAQAWEAGEQQKAGQYKAEGEKKIGETYKAWNPADLAGIEGGKPIPLGKNLRYFGDGFQIAKKIGGKRYWRVPVMDGEFLTEATTGMVDAVGGGNFLVLAESQPQALAACEAAIEEMRKIPNVIMPFPGGVVRSGSKVGSKYASLGASTNDAFCPTLKGVTKTDLSPEIESVMEIVIDGLSKEDIDKAMRVGIQAVCDLGAANGIKRISAGNYGGKLGPFHFHLQEIMA